MVAASGVGGVGAILRLVQEERSIDAPTATQARSRRQTLLLEIRFIASLPPSRAVRFAVEPGGQYARVSKERRGRSMDGERFSSALNLTDYFLDNTGFSFFRQLSSRDSSK